MAIVRINSLEVSMAKVAIVTDSTGYITPEVTRNLPIYYIPLHVIWGEETFLDNVDITPDQFYAKLKIGQSITFDFSAITGGLSRFVCAPDR